MKKSNLAAMRDMEEELKRLKRIYADLSMQNDLLTLRANFLAKAAPQSAISALSSHRKMQKLPHSRRV